MQKRRITSFCVFLFSAFLFLAVSSNPPAAFASCAGDCNNDGSVTVDEILSGVNVAMGGMPLESCVSFDSNGDGSVTVDEIILAVNNALNGCPVASADPYAAHPVVSGLTVPEARSAASVPGADTNLSLGDNTRISVPFLSNPFTVKLERQSSTMGLSDDALKGTGSMRVVTFDGLVPDTEYLPVTLTFPAVEYGDINPDTLVVVRKASLLIDGEAMPDTLAQLSVNVGSDRSITVSDFFFPFTVPSVAAALAARASSESASIEVKAEYSIATRQENLNWKRSPLLVRMVPDGSVPEQRRPLDKLAAPEKAAEESKCVRNVIVLVHGHNEDELDGGNVPAIAELS